MLRSLRTKPILVRGDSWNDGGWLRVARRFRVLRSGGGGGGGGRGGDEIRGVVGRGG